MNRRKYISQDETKNQSYFENNFLSPDNTDITKQLIVKNTLGLSLLEGFNKWAKAGLTAFVSHEYRRFTMTDTIADNPGQRIQTDYVENVVSVGGQLIKEQGKTLHYNVTGEVALLGEDIGQFQIEGTGDLNFRLFNDTVRLEANAYIKNLNPVFYYRHFHSKHYWWDQDLSKIMRTRIEGKLSIDHWKTQLRAGVENITNYTYLDNASVKYTATTEEKETVTYKMTWLSVSTLEIFKFLVPAYAKTSNGVSCISTMKLLIRNRATKMYSLYPTCHCTITFTSVLALPKRY